MKTSTFHPRRGLTLVELLVVISIMVMLVAVSIPVFKPMLESQRTAGAARIVAGALQRTRIKAMESQQDVLGLEFVRFDEGNAPNVAIQLRLVRTANPFVTPESMRVVVGGGTIKVCAWDNSTGKWKEDTTSTTTWNNNVKAGHRIQFGRQGRVYDLDTSTTLASPYDNLTLPDQDISGGSPYAWAMEASVSRSPLPTLSPQVVLPRGTVVDLRYSGTSGASNSSTKSFSGGGSVAVQFSPGGFVDGVMTGSNNVAERINDVVYFCIGEWERSGNNHGDTYAEDGRCNLLMPSNFWVTVNPKSGQVRITEFAVTTKSPATDLSDALDEARKLATENALNIGGF